MPLVSAFVPDDLARSVREANIPVTEVCQRALSDAVAAANRLGADPRAESGPSRVSVASRLTDRARYTLSVGQERARANHEPLRSHHVLAGLIAEGHNLALAVLSAMGADVGAILGRAERLAASRVESDDDEEADDEARAMLERAGAEADGLGHHYVGCEHLLLSVATGALDDPTVVALGEAAVDLDELRRAVKIGVVGILHAQSNPSALVLNASIRGVLEEIRTRLDRLDGTAP